VAQSTPSLSAGREVRRHPQYGSSDDDQTASLRPIARVHNSAATTLFGTAGRFDIIEFWAYIAIVAAVSVLSLIILDADLMQERMRPGGRRVGLHFPPIIIVMFLHWTVKWPPLFHRI
jgi:hypothetical protein